MAAHQSWVSLPSIIIVEILSYLSLTDKLNTSATCKRWRGCLYHPSLWKGMTFRVRNQDRKKAKHLAEMCGKFVKEAVVVLDSKIHTNVRECVTVLEKLSANVNLEKFALQPNSCHLEWPQWEHDRTIDLYLSCLEQLCGNSRRLQHVALGCIGELTDHADSLLPLLSSTQSSTLNALHLASIKEDPDSYGLINLPISPFQSLYNLQELSLDYDYLSTSLLSIFTRPGRAAMKKLIIHVHGIELGREPLSNNMWKDVVHANPELEVTLNLIHSIDGAVGLLELLRPAMPLAHLRMLFCQHLNMAAIHFLVQHCVNTLQSVYIIDGMEDFQPNIYEHHQLDEDPFVMMAWRCPRLCSFTLIGYDLNKDDLIAMARLRESSLKELVIPECCISSLEEDGEEIYTTYNTDISQLSSEISKWLGRSWTPVADSELHPAVTDPAADAETAYLPLLLQDQVW